MTERALLVKCATSGDLCAIGIEAPSAIRIFRVSDQSLAFTASAIPPVELGNNGGNNAATLAGATSFHSHSTINESLSAIALSAPSLSFAQQQNQHQNQQQHQQQQEQVLVMGTSAGRVSLFDCVAGRLRWTTFVPDGSNTVTIRCAAVCGNFVFAATSRNTLHIFETNRGALVFSGGRGGASAVQVGNAKSLAACFADAEASSLALLVGGLHPVVYRLPVAFGSNQQQQQQQLLEPFSMCTVQSSPCDRVIIFKSNSNRNRTTDNNQDSFLLGATCCFSEGLIRVWKLIQGQAICLFVCDVASSSSSSASLIPGSGGGAQSSSLSSGGGGGFGFYQQRFSHFDMTLSSSSSSSATAAAASACLLRVTASTVSGTMFLWNLETPNTSTSTISSSSKSQAPSAIFLSPESLAASSSNNNIRNRNNKVAAASSRIVASFFFSRGQDDHSPTATTDNNTSSLLSSSSVVVIRKNWSTPVFQSWLWSQLVASSSSASMIQQEPKILPELTTSRGGRSASNEEFVDEDGAAGRGAAAGAGAEQNRRFIHLPSSVGKRTAATALRGLDLPSAGAFAFPKVTLFHASDVSQLPTGATSQQQQQQQEGVENLGDGGGADDSEQQQRQENQALLAARRRAGVTPALYQALHADDTPMLMELLNVGGRSALDREATVLALSLPYVVKLIHILSKRLIDEGTARGPLHVWISSIMKLRGKELFAIVRQEEEENEDDENEENENQQNNNNRNTINAQTLRATLLPLLEHYRAILSAVGTSAAFAAGRTSIFKAVKRRAMVSSNSGQKQKRRGGQQQSTATTASAAPVFVDKQHGVVAMKRSAAAASAGGDEDAENGMMMSRNSRRKMKKNKKVATGELIGDEDEDEEETNMYYFDGDDDKRFRVAPDADEDDDNDFLFNGDDEDDEDEDEEDFDDDYGDIMFGDDDDENDQFNDAEVRKLLGIGKKKNKKTMKKNNNQEENENEFTDSDLDDVFPENDDDLLEGIDGLDSSDGGGEDDEEEDENCLQQQAGGGASAGGGGEDDNQNILASTDDDDDDDDDDDINDTGANGNDNIFSSASSRRNRRIGNVDGQIDFD